MSLLWRTATQAGEDSLHPEHFGWDLDHNAPNYFPENLERRTVTVHPDDELTATQRDLDPNHPALHHFDRSEAERERPSLVSMDGTRYISDGHHRLAGAKKARSPIKADLWYDPDEEF